MDCSSTRPHHDPRTSRKSHLLQRSGRRTRSRRCAPPAPWAWRCSRSVAFGVLVTHAGLAWWWAAAFTTLIYAGSFEFLLVGLVVAAAPVPAVAATAFLVNVRHIFYALSFPLDRVQGRVARAYSTFAMTDEAYALTTGQETRGWSSRRIVSLQVFLHLYWVGGATVGALLGAVVPDSVRGLDFALTALFAVLALDAVRSRPRDTTTPVLAAASAAIARVAFPDQMLLAGFVLFTGALLLQRKEQADA